MKKLSMAEAMSVVGGTCKTCTFAYNKVSINGGTAVCVQTTSCVDKYGNVTRMSNPVSSTYCPVTPN